MLILASFSSRRINRKKSQLLPCLIYSGNIFLQKHIVATVAKLSLASTSDERTKRNNQKRWKQVLLYIGEIFGRNIQYSNCCFACLGFLERQENNHICCHVIEGNISCFYIGNIFCRNANINDCCYAFLGFREKDRRTIWKNLVYILRQTFLQKHMIATVATLVLASLSSRRTK